MAQEMKLRNRQGQTTLKHIKSSESISAFDFKYNSKRMEDCK